ncbi:VIT domain-containing protein [Kordia algicida OT-1]|uniref:VIT domain-containing protein n=1 Tax=Kordia algicida OT-1 TaxID=391587 RepID=A9DZK0_9FLAO|nr:VIT domain-containing protein [Kordia algicida]EDP95736.1 hypothetical protein KAOT1_05012 [Kordia algicida OT-1]
MKTFVSFVLLLLCTAISSAQEPPVLKAGKTQVGLSSLDITVEIIGNKTTTTFDMLYYNPTNQVLEGELSFPLGENCNVSRFALDVNGKLREAVVVDKELGRIAFEEVVRRRVDPALLEKGTGNNYKARIYPIPQKGYKRVVLAYEQELLYKKDGYYFDLPLNFKNKLDTFKLTITVFEQDTKPVIEKGKVSGLNFQDWQRNFRTKLEKQNYIPNTSLLIKIPTKVGAKKVVVSDDYFYSHLILNPQKKLRKKATEITMFWDASLSMKDRDLKKEIELLATYFSHVKNVKVHLKTFSNTVLSRKTFDIRNGNWSTLKSELEATIYDGATNYNVLNTEFKNSDLVFFFSDGIQSLSNFNYYSDTPLIVFNSLKKSNHPALKKMAEASKGTYINLTSKSATEAFSAIKYQQYQYLGFKSYSKNIDIYPNRFTNVGNTFSIAGKNLNSEESIILYFGYDNVITERVELNLSKAQKDAGNIPRMWAQKRLAYLQENSKVNKAEIVNLATKYGLVTDYTSLIVLEEVRDYIRYNIKPPAELLNEYNKIIAEKERRNKQLKNGETIPIVDRIQVVEEDSKISERLIVTENIGNGFVNSSTFGYSQPSPVNIQEIDVLEEVDDVEITEEEEPIEDIPFVMIEESPIFPGCEAFRDLAERKKCFAKKMQKHIADNFNIAAVSQLNLSAGIQRAYALFIIDEEGNIKNIRTRAPHPRVAEEVIRVLNLLPQMIPAKQRHKNVSIRYTLPIIFRVNADGNVVTETSTNSSTNNNTIRNSRAQNLKTYGTLKVADQTVSEPYIEELRKFKTVFEAYDFYLLQRESYLEVPAYYVDVSNFFRDEFEAFKHSDRILSNITETDFDNYELLKVYAYQLQATNQHQLALFILKRVLELRPEDVQSYRDLALAHENLGECQEAFDLLERVVSGDIYEGTRRRKFSGLNKIVKNEINHLLEKYKTDLDTSKLDTKVITPETYDVRIVVDWNHNDTDIDLHVIDPNYEECYYKHSKTKIGGEISQDMTQGFGPEEFTLKKAIKGDYFVKIKYFGDRYQKIENPTFMKVTLYTDYGTIQETKQVKVIRLTKSKDQTIVAKLRF